MELVQNTEYISSRHEQLLQDVQVLPVLNTSRAGCVPRSVPYPQHKTALEPTLNPKATLKPLSLRQKPRSIRKRLSPVTESKPFLIYTHFIIVLSCLKAYHSILSGSNTLYYILLYKLYILSNCFILCYITLNPKP